MSAVEVLPPEPRPRPAYAWAARLSVVLYMAAFLGGFAYHWKTRGTAPGLETNSLDRAQELAGRGELAAALREYRTAASIDRLNYSLATKIADLAGRSGDTSAEIEKYQRARAIWPRDPAVHRSLGLSYFKQHRYEEALRSFQDALDLKPGDSEAASAMADTLVELTTWPWLSRPPLLYFERTAEPPTTQVIVALGNPAIWWLSLPAALAALVSGLVVRDSRRIFAACGFFAAYLVWAVSPRPLQYSYYFFEALPYACLCIAFFVDRGWDGPLRLLCRGYSAVTALLLPYFLPVLTAMPISNAIFYHRLFADVYPWRWLASWYVP